MTAHRTLALRTVTICIAAILLVSHGGFTGPSVLCCSTDGHVAMESMLAGCRAPAVAPASPIPTPQATMAHHGASCTDLLVKPAAHQRKQTRGDSLDAGTQYLAARALEVNLDPPTGGAPAIAPGSAPLRRSPVSDVVLLI